MEEPLPLSTYICTYSLFLPTYMYVYYGLQQHEIPAQIRIKVSGQKVHCVVNHSKVKSVKFGVVDHFIDTAKF